MSYETARDKILVILNDEYGSGDSTLIDLRAALKACDLVMENYQAFETTQIIIDNNAKQPS